MLERTAVGRQTRRYLIQMEAAALQMASYHVAKGTPEAIPQAFFDTLTFWIRFFSYLQAVVACGWPDAAPFR